MNLFIGKRYVAHSQILALSNGLLYNGEDTSLQREVLLYTTKNQQGASDDEYVCKLRKASTLAHDGFLHIFDTSFEEDSILIVLKYIQGKPLIHGLKQQIWTFPRIITLVADLGVSILDAMEEQITGFSVAAENLWLSEDERLSVINYWEDGEPQTIGAIGLCNLMIQLFSGLAEIQDPDEAFDTYLYRVGLHQASAEQKEALIKLVRRVYQGKASLSSLIFGLQDLSQANRSTEKEQPVNAPIPDAAALSRLQTQQRTATANVIIESIPPESDFMVEETIPFYKKKPIIIASSLIVVILLIWVLWPPHKSERNPSITATDSSNPAQEATPQITAEPQQSTEAPVDGGQSQNITIPKLVGMTQSDAEKQALSFGLHYSFVIEANSEAKGIVFKQDPEPDTPGVKGDNIKFWVSKGTP
ncbi:MAG: hypothetical protein JWM44_2252 [Bacilli bacterium]|nr:hypothetical protein [Bacilli bacterium]